MSEDTTTFKPTINTKEELIGRFGADDYTIFGLMLSVSAIIGIYSFVISFIRSKNDVNEILLGGRSMGLIPITLSLVASFMSAITLLGTPAEMYVYGTQYCILVFSYPFVMASAAHLFLPVFFKLNVSTSYEYLEWRFDKFARIIGSALFTLQMVLYMAIVVYTPALALSQVTGFEVDHAVAVIFAVCIFYTTIGGIKAVMWTDTFQAIVMFGSFLAVIIKGNYDAGGTSKVFDTNYQSGRIVLFDFDPDITSRHTVWGLIIGGYFTWISIYGINQTQVQRYLSVPDMKIAVKAIWWNVLGIGSLLLMCAYAGLVVFGFYANAGCDPINSKLVETKDQLFPLFVMQVMGEYPCIPGLFVAGVFSGALSTVSSGLNSLAAVTLKDFLYGGCNVLMSPNLSAWTTRGLAAVYGFLSYLVVFAVKNIDGVLEAAFGVFGIVGGPVLGAFTLGMFFPHANSLGVNIGMIVSLTFTMWMGFGQTVAKVNKQYIAPQMPRTIEGCPEIWNITAPEPSPPTDPAFPLYNVSYIWFSAIACFTVLIVGNIVSYFTTPQDPKKLNPDLISPGLKWILGSYGKDFFKSIGVNYVETEKERKLRKGQITEIEENTNENKVIEGNANGGFELREQI